MFIEFIKKKHLLYLVPPPPPPPPLSRLYLYHMLLAGLVLGGPFHGAAPQVHRELWFRLTASELDGEREERRERREGEKEKRDGKRERREKREREKERGERRDNMRLEERWRHGVR